MRYMDSISTGMWQTPVSCSIFICVATFDYVFIAVVPLNYRSDSCQIFFFISREVKFILQTFQVIERRRVG